MAGVDVGPQGGHKRATNSDINMVPFIDLLFVTVAFLLITAVWVTNSLDATVMRYESLHLPATSRSAGTRSAKS